MQQTELYIITAIVSIVVAIVLARLSYLTGVSRAGVGFGTLASSSRKIQPDDTLRERISSELASVVGTGEQSKKVGDVVSTIVATEVEKNVERTSQELSRKYQTLVKEKEQSEDIAWKKYKKVLSEKKETEAVIKSIAEGLVVVDSTGKVIMINPAAERLLGVSNADKVGKPIGENIREDQLVSIAKEGDDKKGNEIELLSQNDSTKKVVRASTAVIENESGQTVGMVTILNDVTKQRTLDRMKSSFVASVSHELRTPLIAIQKSIDLILSKTTGELSAAQEQFLSIAERNLKRLSSLIDDLLDLSKLEDGKTALKRVRTAVEKVINESVEGLNTWAKSKSIDIVRRIDPGLPDVFIEPNRIIQVVTNLLGNALKFTPSKGTITITAALEPDKKSVCVGVADSGIGIPPEQLEKVFEKFFQIGERNPSDINGTGIGLAIAKEIVQLHGGRIWAESEQSSGARFFFTLPVAE